MQDAACDKYILAHVLYSHEGPKLENLDQSQRREFSKFVSILKNQIKSLYLHNLTTSSLYKPCNQKDTEEVNLIL
jgi:hypothetical protein